MRIAADKEKTEEWVIPIGKTVSAGDAVFFRIQKLGKARIFLKKGEIFVIAGVITVFRTKLDSDLEIGHGGIGFAGQAVKSSERVMNMVRFWGCLARLEETLAGVVPAPDVHHGDAALIMLFRRARVLFVAGFHALLGDLQVHARTIRQLFARPFQNFFQLLLGAGKFLLMKKGEGFVVQF